MKRPTVKLAWREDRGYPELRVIANRRMHRMDLGFPRCEPGQWNELAQRFTKGLRDHASVNATAEHLLRLANATVDHLVQQGNWSWSEFVKRFTGGNEDTTVVAYMRHIEQELEDLDRPGNAAVYANAAAALDRHLNGRAIRFAELTMEVLYGVDKMMRRNGAQDGGISNVMRTIRAAVNRAMKEGLAKPEHYPFATARTKGYEMKMLKKKRVSRALSDAEMDLYKAFPFAKHPALAYNVRLLLIIYYARGMNFADLAYLRDEDIQGKRIRYQRQKTIRRGGKVLSIPIAGPLAKLLKALPPGTDGYVLPILNKRHATAKQKMHRIDRMRKLMNEDLRAAAKILGIKGNVTTYVGRHTYAMRLKRNNVDGRKISELMGHAGMATTEPYLGQWEDEALDKTDEVL